jgi:alpha-mannosidase
MLLDAKIPAKIGHIEKTYDALRYATVCPVAMDFAETVEHFRGVPPASAELDWKPVRVGETWGDDWGTAWLRGSVTIPESLAGNMVFLRADTGAPESMLLVDGVHRGVFDVNHPVRLLTLSGVAGARHEVHLEAYAGHSFPGTQPSVDERVVVTKGCRKFGTVEVVQERGDVSAFVFELRALRQLMETLDENSLRRGRIQRAMERVFTVVYAKPAEVEEAVWREALAKAREVMRPLLAERNGPSTPRIGIIGHSHIDTAWLWTVGETWRKCARTFSSILSLMDQYPEFKFVQSAACHADQMRQLYPEIFARMQERVKEGRWEINGGTWIEPDCNIPSGESLVRQFLVGQRATREMFGKTSDTLWQPDVFGYSGALPQILRGCGVEFFCTTKLGWNDTNRFPYDTFIWQGVDGSEVLSHFNLIHCWPDPETLVNSWKRIQHKDVQDRQFISFGYGDGGGGPQAQMIEMARLVKDLEGCPKAEYETVSEFMTSCRDELTVLPRWSGELYLELHRGTLTSIAAIKSFNRMCELALRDAEFVSTLAALGSDQPYPAVALLDTWKLLLLNQFHDILPGSSIAEVNDEALRTFERCLGQAAGLRSRALASLSSGKTPSTGQTLVVANSLSWERTGEMELDGVPAGMRPAGTVVQPFDDVEGRAKLAVSGLTLPSLGYASVDLEKTDKPAPTPFKMDGDTIETPFAGVTFDEGGRIVSFYDLESRRELVRNGGAFNAFLIGEDVPAAWDNWDIDRDQRLKLTPVDALDGFTVVANGPLQLRLRRRYDIGKSSTIVQDVVFHATTPRVDFDTVVDWHEKYQFLKAAFAVDVLTDFGRHEIQFGHVARSTHDNTTFDRAQFDVCAHKWTDLSETSFGVAFMNDCKYACTTKDGEYRLSLIKSGRHPDPRGDEGRHRFSYAILPHAGGFSAEAVIRPAYEFNIAPTVVNGSADDRGFTLIQVDAPNVIVEAVKWADDGEGFILRLYEAEKTGTHARLAFGIPVSAVEEVDMLEEHPRALTVVDRSVELYFRPFEIKTLRVRHLPL